MYEVRLQVEDPNGALHTANNFTRVGGSSEELSIPEGKSRVYAIYKTAADFKTVYVDADLKNCKKYVATANSNYGSFYLNITEK